MVEWMRTYNQSAVRRLPPPGAVHGLRHADSHRGARDRARTAVAAAEEDFLPEFDRLAKAIAKGSTPAGNGPAAIVTARASPAPGALLTLRGKVRTQDLRGHAALWDAR